MNQPALFEENPPRLLLFGGKGGVGKTTCAAAVALRLASFSPQDSFLLVSTDPAHSLLDCFGDSHPPSNLSLLELNAKASLLRFKQEHGKKLEEIARRGTFFDDDDIRSLLELSLPGMDELMAFLQLAGWLEEDLYTTVVVDTAPTGHTLRLLSIPRLLHRWLRALDSLLAKHRYMKKLYSGFYQADDVDQFLLGLSLSLKQMEALLRDRRRCAFVPVLLAEALSLFETLSLVRQLKRWKISVGPWLVNRLIPENDCPACSSWRQEQQNTLRQFAAALSRHPLFELPRIPSEICSGEALLHLWSRLQPLSLELDSSTPSTASSTASSSSLSSSSASSSSLSSSSASSSSLSSVPSSSSPSLLTSPPPLVENPFPLDWPLQAIFFAGKGGVGKTTLACATACALTYDLPTPTRILLFSTDPAHSLADCLERPIGSTPTPLAPDLDALQLHAQQEFDHLLALYTEEMKALFGALGSQLDLKFDRQAMEQLLHLAPPGLDELMAFSRAIDILEEGAYQLLLFDTAPTGHLLRLLELPEIIEEWLQLFFSLLLKYKRILRLPRLSRYLVRLSKGLKGLKKLLTDPQKTTLYGVSLPTAMALAETRDLVASCRRLQIPLGGLCLNWLTPQADCPFCDALYQEEGQFLDRFAQEFPTLHQTRIFRGAPPLGVQRLTVLGRQIYHLPQEVSSHARTAL